MTVRTQRTKGKAGKAVGSSKLATSLPAKAVVARLLGGRLSRTRALVAAVAGAVLAYRLLRSGDDE